MPTSRRRAWTDPATEQTFTAFRRETRDVGLAQLQALAVRWAWSRLPPGVRSRLERSRVVSGIRDRMRARLPHDALYDAAYFEILDAGATTSADAMATTIATELAPRSAIDVGCGTGALLAALRDRGIEVVGLEYAESALEYCRRRRLDVVKFDLEAASSRPVGTYDVVISTEVAEHLPQAAADRYVDLLTGLSDVIVFTAATPGQGGVDHVNEQPHEYWIGKFAARGFGFDEARSRAWRSAWAAKGIAPWYTANLMLFERSAPR